MGREVRKVPKDWKHPKDDRGEYKPLYGTSYKQAAAEFMDMATMKGLQEAVGWFGQAPDENDYMPDWELHERTHYVMYEDTTEGTPISPAFDTVEKLARWLADNSASAFGGMTATYDEWLAMCKSGWAPSAVIDSNGLHSGVAVAQQLKDH